jgi:adenosylcobinamide-GDP ribazoletransferase
VWLSESLPYFPLVGLLLGVLMAAFYWACSFVLPHALTLALTLGLGLLVTGGFHEDGWADVCDGMGGAYTRQRVLEIMKDSRVGAFGAMGLTWMLLSRFCVFLNLPLAWVILALILGQSISRLAAIALIVGLQHVGDTQHSKTKPLGQQLSFRQWWGAAAALLIALLVVLVLFRFFGFLHINVSVFAFDFYFPFVFVEMLISCFPSWVNDAQWLQFFGALLILIISAAVFAFLFAALLSAYFYRRIGGYTGDCLGATQQVAELAVGVLVNVLFLKWFTV